MTFRIRRVTTTRAGGVSKAPFDTFNLGDHVGDDPKAVAANRTRLADAIGHGPLVWMNQVHGDHVEVVEGPGTGAGGAYDNTDALVTATTQSAGSNIPGAPAPVDEALRVGFTGATRLALGAAGVFLLVGLGGSLVVRRRSR